MKRHELLTITMLLAFSALASAEEIYRCGPNGATYSQTPCSNGVRVDRPDSRTEQQRSEAVSLAAKTEAWGAALERDRIATEAAHWPALAGSLNTPSMRPVDDKPRSMPTLKRKQLRSKQVRHPRLSSGR